MIARPSRIDVHHNLGLSTASFREQTIIAGTFSSRRPPAQHRGHSVVATSAGLSVSLDLGGAGGQQVQRGDPDGLERRLHRPHRRNKDLQGDRKRRVKFGQSYRLDRFVFPYLALVPRSPVDCKHRDRGIQIERACELHGAKIVVYHKH